MLTALEAAGRLAIARLKQNVAGRVRTDIPAIIFEQYRIAYIPIPKAANSSVRAALLPLIGLPAGSIRSIQAFKGFEERKLSECLNVDSTWFCFTVVRDPFSRIASAYQDKVVERQEILPAMAKMGIRKGDSFETFVRHIDRWPKKRLDRHVAPQALMLSHAPSQIGVNVFKMEDLSVSWPTISNLIERQSGIGIGNLERRNKSTFASPWRSLYTPETISMVCKIYADDFRAFSYSCAFSTL